MPSRRGLRRRRIFHVAAQAEVVPLLQRNVTMNLGGQARATAAVKSNGEQAAIPQVDVRAQRFPDCRADMMLENAGVCWYFFCWGLYVYAASACKSRLFLEVQCFRAHSRKREGFLFLTPACVNCETLKAARLPLSTSR